MERRWSKPEMWVPGGYLALVVAMLVWVEVGDIGFGGTWPMLATAPVSLLLLVPFGPASDALHSAPVVEPHYGSQPPTPLPLEYPSESAPLPADWTPDTSVAAQPEMWAGLGFHAAVLAGALINAVALWALLRHWARQRNSKGAQVQSSQRMFRGYARGVATGGPEGLACGDQCHATLSVLTPRSGSELEDGAGLPPGAQGRCCFT
ncbi:hypothetical protein OG765_01090 [Streptomyces sp. NBC_00555]|uniref:SCO4225 family membrane protein n=1 Tax=Streptomyces sp. NBC_00555 TaxID=2903662 RepID=UPI00225C15F0|nr:hypothetical protein [Streptomyces sp. NBC_00555]MCX5009590.1 hypothetical protein [Streptomyces sp. NBC_00555]